MSTLPRPLLEIKFANAAEAYLRSLPPEHFMEAIPQATQREISLGSFAVLRTFRPDLHYFNELLVQYLLRGRQEIHQVVPDNMVVLSSESIKAVGSYAVPLQPVPPFWVLEYVSKESKRKDYEDNFRKYERELRVPYYLLFYPDTQDLTLFHRGGPPLCINPAERGRAPGPCGVGPGDGQPRRLGPLLVSRRVAAIAGRAARETR